MPDARRAIDHCVKRLYPEQGRGLGGEALDLVLDHIRTKPFGDSPRVALTCHKDNRVALGLYAKKGFVPTGAVYDDEVELPTTVG